jgi:uncharacterized membrane protein
VLWLGEEILGLKTFLILAFDEACTTMGIYGFGFGYWEPSKVT